ncbi:MAG: hypothetical protein U0V75_02165 [Ferruginibacter sp.]
MRAIILSLVILFTVSVFVSSCARGITVEQAANGKARCGKNYIR